MSIPEINLEQARLIQLAALGLLEPPSRQAVKEDVVAAIRGMGILQIDTINVVARSPYLVLFSRLEITRQPGSTNRWPKGWFSSTGRTPPALSPSMIFHLTAGSWWTAIAW